VIEVGSFSGHLVVGVMWLMGLAVSLIEARRPEARRLSFALALTAVIATVVITGLLWPGDAGVELAGGGLRLDGFALFVQAFGLISVVFSLLLGRHQRAAWPPGSDGLLLLASAGVALLAMATDLLAVMAGFAAATIPLLGMAALNPSEQGREGALKGLVMTALGLALLGLGTALLFSRTGTTTLEGLRTFLSQATWIGDDPLRVVALGLILSGLGMFLAVVPFHMLFTDVIEGLPAPAALLLSGGLIASGLAACGRILLVGFGTLGQSGPGYLSWTEVLHVAGLMALLVGNGMALVQPRLKRMLACLAAGQAGLVMLTLAAAGQAAGLPGSGPGKALAGILVFLAVHALTWVGLFVAVGVIDDPSGRAGLGRLEGLARSHPWLAAAIGLALLCMAGMPLTAGFFARIYLLEAMVDAGWVGTAIAVALSLGLVLVMSLGLVTTMFMRPARQDVQVHTSAALIITAWLASLSILLLGILPGGFWTLALRSAGSLFAPGA
jgi:NADH-quinone oxidoreductase subunit N